MPTRNANAPRIIPDKSGCQNRAYDSRSFELKLRAASPRSKEFANREVRVADVEICMFQGLKRDRTLAVTKGFTLSHEIAFEKVQSSRREHRTEDTSTAP